MRCFVQYEFYRQWKALKNYANVNKIEIMGDIPFYVGLDSLDVWMNQDEFLLEQMETDVLQEFLQIILVKTGSARAIRSMTGSV